MTKAASLQNTEIQRLMTILLSTLDESFFFSELAKHLQSEIGAERVKAFKVVHEKEAKLVCQDAKAVLSDEIITSGPAISVIRSKRAYFCNDISRDPVFEKEVSEGVKKELVIPVSHEGIVIGTIHFQQINELEKEYSKDDITHVLSVLKHLSGPIANMKMYLSAKSLNESLLRKIEQKENELKEKSHSLATHKRFTTNEGKIVGKSQIMGEAVRLGDKVAATSVNVLIEGEKATGKELIARRIHCRSSRHEESFATIDCSLMNDRELDKELFGHEIPELGGAEGIIKGLLEVTDNGTLFIKNIDKMHIAVQAKLNRFLKDRMSYRVNGQTPFQSDVRIVASSCESLRARVEEGCFREDLYYELNTMIINVPSLRERGDDIEIIANYFLNLGKDKMSQKSFSPAALNALLDYHWPGNVRELQNVVERSYIMSEGMIIEKSHLAAHVLDSDLEDQSAEDEREDFTEMTLDDLERKHITRTLEHLGGNKTKTAKTLGITVKTLYNKLHSYGMIASKEA